MLAIPPPSLVMYSKMASATFSESITLEFQFGKFISPSIHTYAQTVKNAALVIIVLLVYTAHHTGISGV